MFDRLHLGTQQVSAVMGTIAAAIAVSFDALSKCVAAIFHGQSRIAVEHGRA